MFFQYSDYNKEVPWWERCLTVWSSVMPKYIDSDLTRLFSKRAWTLEESELLNPYYFVRGNGHTRFPCLLVLCVSSSLQVLICFRPKPLGRSSSTQC